MKYPNLVYKSPGDHQCPGGTFNYLSVASEDDVAKAAKDGYYPTVELAVSKPSDFDWGEYLGYGKQEDSEVEEAELAASVVDETSSREDLEAEATRLGIGFSARTKDSSLLRKIKEKEGA